MNEKSGEWYLPNSDLKIPGRLYIDKEKKKIILKLFTSIYLKGKAVENRASDEDWYNEIILGTSSNSLVTLYSCSLYSDYPIKKDFHELEYEIEYVFDRVHIYDSKKLLLKNISVSFPNMRTFFNGFKSLTDNNKQEEYYKIDREILINENFKIVLSDIKSKHISVGKDYKIKHSKSIDFEYKEPVDFDTANKDCYTFLRMLEFSARKNLAFKISSAKIELKNITNYEDKLYINNKGKFEKPDYAHTLIYSKLDFNEEPFLDKKMWHQNFLLFSGWSESNEEIDRIINKWYSNKSLMPIYDFYIDSNNWFKGKVALSNVMFNNKFLNLVQALEAFYDFLDPSYTYTNEEFTKTRQKVINEINDKELKSWTLNFLKYPTQPKLAFKLSHLCNRYQKIISVFFEESDFLNSYPRKAKDYRNKLSHGKIDKTYQGEGMSNYYKFSQILLCICILDSLDMPFDKITDRIKTNPLIGFSISDIRDATKNN